MRCAIYGRVSTAEQNAAIQLDELRAHCQRLQWEIVEEFIDAGVSGAKESRPAFEPAASGRQTAKVRCGAGILLRPLRPLTAPAGECSRRIRCAWNPLHQPA